MCPNCEKYLDNIKVDIVVCGECGQLYMMHNSIFYECKLRKNKKGNIVAFIEGKEIKLDSKEKEVMKSFEIIRSALPYSGGGSSVRVSLPFSGTEAFLFQ